MKKLIAKANVMIEALPYIRNFYEKTVIIKYGGSAMLDKKIRKEVLQDIVFMNYVGLRPIIVHGGGPFISERLKKLNKEVKFVGGLRVTNEENIRIVEEALTEVNREIVKDIIQLGSSAISLSGKDDHLIETRKHSNIEGVDVGFVGDIVRINGDILEKLVTSDIIPVISPIGIGRDGYTYNVNADDAAAEIARDVRAIKLILLTDVEGICKKRKDPNSLMSHASAKEVEAMIKKKIISDGMIPKTRACLKSLDKAGNKAHIISGKIPHALLLEIFTDKGIGTEIVRK